MKSYCRFWCTSPFKALPYTENDNNSEIFDAIDEAVVWDFVEAQPLHASR
ncbi:MAG: hypothetical protein WBG92_19600 [Thiohalocapsa sp.]